MDYLKRALARLLLSGPTNDKLDVENEEKRNLLDEGFLLLCTIVWENAYKYYNQKEREREKVGREREREREKKK